MQNEMMTSNAENTLENLQRLEASLRHYVHDAILHPHAAINEAHPRSRRLVLAILSDVLTMVQMTMRASPGEVWCYDRVILESLQSLRSRADSPSVQIEGGAL